jgi:hypothetical protein
MDIKLSTRPFPYFVAESVLPPETIQMMRRNWPGEGNFAAEVPGNYVCDLRPFMGEGFWQQFTEGVLPGIVRSSVAAFADWIELRYPGLDSLFVSNYSLMQAKGNYGGHDVHNHHYHDPTWVLTMLLYLDADAEGHHGTTLLKPAERPGRDAPYIAAQTLNWQDFTEEHETVEYRQARLLAFHDNVIAFHSVKPSRPGAIFGRRILRLHLMAPPDQLQRLYGVDYETYRKKRLNPTSDPAVLAWMRRDLGQLEIPRPASAEQREAWASKVQIAL